MACDSRTVKRGCIKRIRTPSRGNLLWAMAYVYVWKMAVDGSCLIEESILNE